MTGARGEGRLQSGDREITILFTNRALAEAEQVLGKTVIQLAQGARDGNLGITDVAQLLALGMEHARREAGEAGRRVSIRDAFDVLDGAGFTACTTVVMESLAAVLSYRAGEAAGEDPTRTTARKRGGTGNAS